MSKFGHEPGSSYLHSTVSRRLYSTRFSLDQSQGRTPLYHRPSTGEGDVSRPAETDGETHGETTAPANTAINHSPHVALLAGRSGVRRHRRGRRAGTRVQARRRYAIDEERRLNHRSELIPSLALNPPMDIRHRQPWTRHRHRAQREQWAALFPTNAWPSRRQTKTADYLRDGAGGCVCVGWGVGAVTQL